MTEVLQSCDKNLNYAYSKGSKFLRINHPPEGVTPKYFRFDFPAILKLIKPAVFVYLRSDKKKETPGAKPESRNWSQISASISINASFFIRKQKLK